MRYFIYILIGLLLGLSSGIQAAEKSQYPVENNNSINRVLIIEIDSQADILFDDLGIDFSGLGDAILTMSVHPGLLSSTRLSLKNTALVCHSVSLLALLIDLPPPCLV